MSEPVNDSAPCHPPRGGVYFWPVAGLEVEQLPAELVPIPDPQGSKVDISRHRREVLLG